MNYKVYAIGFLYDKSASMPGLTDFIKFYNLPILLNFTIVRLNLISMLSNNLNKRYVVFGDSHKKIIDDINILEKKDEFTSIYVNPDDQLNNFSAKLSTIFTNEKLQDKDYIALIPLEYTAVWEFDFGKLSADIYKITIEKNAVPIFVAKVSIVKDIIKQFQFETVAHYLKHFAAKKVNEINAKTIELAFANVKEYVQLHFLLFNNSSRIWDFVINYSSFIASSKQETHFGRESNIVNSYVGFQSIIRGHLENSVVFNDVTIMPDTDIINSIILPGAVIGKGVKIKNAIIGFSSNPGKDITIGSHTFIGVGDGKNYKNTLYDKLIPEGYTLIGNNIMLPGSFRIGKNCVIRGNVNYNDLKKLKSLTDGGTFEQ